MTGLLDISADIHFLQTYTDDMSNNPVIKEIILNKVHILIQNSKAVDVSSLGDASSIRIY